MIALIVALVAGPAEPPKNHRLAMAIFFEESSGRLNPPPGDGGKAIGPMQIWKITVDDANRILRENRFTYADRLDLERSVEIFWIVSDHYCRHFRDWSDEGRARRWNRGPDRKKWEDRHGTIYWNKVKKWL